MIVGTVRETKTEEYRVALTPHGVADIVRAGHAVLVERGAGEGSNYPDEEYRAAGAEIVSTPQEVYARTDLICEVKEPQQSEYGLLREGQLLFTYLHLAAEPEVAEALVRSRRIRHDGNPVMRWCAANCEVASDPAGNIKPVKPGGAAQGTRRIDGVVAAVIALSRLMVAPEGTTSPYAHRGVRTVG